MNSEFFASVCICVGIAKILLVLSNFKSILKSFKTTKNSGFGHA